MAAGRVNHQQAVGNGGRPAPHHPIPGNMWTEGLSMADRPQKKKKVVLRKKLKALVIRVARLLPGGRPTWTARHKGI